MDTTKELPAPTLEERADVQPPAPEGPTLGELYAVALAASEASRLAREAARLANEVASRLANWGASAMGDG